MVTKCRCPNKTCCQRITGFWFEVRVTTNACKQLVIKLNTNLCTPRSDAAGSYWYTWITVCWEAVNLATEQFVGAWWLMAVALVSCLFNYVLGEELLFRGILLPKMRGVLTIAVLLRWMDSFLIYAEPFALTGGGPGNTTTFLSIYLVKLATMQFDLGPAAAFSLIYFVIILLFCFVFYQALLNVGRGEKA